jgi:hypothetical protein
MTTPVIDQKKLGGGPYQGYSPVQTINNVKNNGNVIDRKILRNSWNTTYAIGKVNGFNRVTTPFRAVNNLGDFLSRQNYICGGPNQVNKTFPGRQGPIGGIINQCDTTRIQSSTCNVRYVPDSSDYIRFKKLTAVNTNYNDRSFGGDENHASYVPLMAVRRR